MPLGPFLLQPCLEMTWNKATGNTRLLVTEAKDNLCGPSRRRGWARRMGNPRVILTVSSQRGGQSTELSALPARSEPQLPQPTPQPRPEAQLPPGRLKPLVHCHHPQVLQRNKLHCHLMGYPGEVLCILLETSKTGILEALQEEMLTQLHCTSSDLLVRMSPAL